MPILKYKMKDRGTFSECLTPCPHPDTEGVMIYSAACSSCRFYSPSEEGTIKCAWHMSNEERVKQRMEELHAV